jgi:voltage-dependent anion channel protein 2
MLKKLIQGSGGCLCRADKGDTLKASYLHTVSPVSRTTVAAEIAHKISKNENTFTVGGLYELDVLTTVKARLNNHGKLAALLQHEWRPKSLVTISGEVDTKALDKSAKMGLAVSLKP